MDNWVLAQNNSNKTIQELSCKTYRITSHCSCPHTCYSLSLCGVPLYQERTVRRGPRPPPVLTIHRRDSQASAYSRAQGYLWWIPVKWIQTKSAKGKTRGWSLEGTKSRLPTVPPSGVTQEEFWIQVTCYRPGKRGESVPRLSLGACHTGSLSLFTLQEDSRCSGSVGHDNWQTDQVQQVFIGWADGKEPG